MDEIKICKYCKEDIEQKDLHKSKYAKREYCSVSCAAKTRVGSKNPFYGKKHNITTKQKISEHTKEQFKMGMPIETKIKISKKNKGRIPHNHIFTKEQIDKRNKIVKLSISKNKHWNWKGGISPIMMRIRKSEHYNKWRQRVYERDGFQCIDCNHDKSGDLNAHHKTHFNNIIENNNIKSLEGAYNCEDLWDINNGETLCIPCHKEKHRGVSIEKP